MNLATLRASAWRSVTRRLLERRRRDAGGLPSSRADHSLTRQEREQIVSDVLGLRADLRSAKADVNAVARRVSFLEAPMPDVAAGQRAQVLAAANRRISEGTLNLSGQAKRG